jgi:hypothetical protein
MKHAFKEGVNGRRKGHPLNANPYTKDDHPKRHEEWEHGWKDEDKFIRGLEPPENINVLTAWKQ